MYTLYSFLLTVGFILMTPIFLLKREKYAAGFRQRLGVLPEFVPDGRRVVWLHCVSVGETNAARPLVEEILKSFPDCRLIVSTTTRTGQELAREIFKDKAAAVFYFPFDFKFSVRRALRHFRPAAILLVETEIWFNFLREANKSGALTAIVNGRLSERSCRRYSYIKNFIRRVLTYVDLALMQGNADAKRLMALGAHPTKVKVTGNIKFDQSFEPGALTGALGERFGITPEAPLIVAASTHAPEERRLLEAFKLLWKDSLERLPRLLLVPRHPERFDEVAGLIAETGFEWVRRSAAASEKDRRAEIILLDSIGELRAVYPLAEIVFVGGSLIPHGGQSILEPAVAGKPIATGFYTMNFAAAVREFLEHDALIQLPETDEQSIAGELARVFTDLLKDPEKRAALSRNALDVMRRNRGATARTIENLKPFLSRAE
ncbi:MAG: 3-deoxy-D-manno-octulosonic acid transferase [Acidobacteria bacterium]|nr:3-deoxy-D-manno-octulosonic acid transferase [Acidobacteriota bacterium]